MSTCSHSTNWTKIQNRFDTKVMERACLFFSKKPNISKRTTVEDFMPMLKKPKEFFFVFFRFAQLDQSVCTWQNMRPARPRSVGRFSLSTPPNIDLINLLDFLFISAPNCIFFTDALMN